jgi:hypothetical protein
MAIDSRLQQGQPQPNRVAIDPRLQQGQPQPNRVEDMLKIQDTVQNGGMKEKISMMSQQQAPMSSSGMSGPTQPTPMSPGGMGGSVPNDQEKAEAGDKVLKIVTMEGLLDRAGITEQQLNSAFASLMGNTVDEFKARQSGGLIGMAAGGNFAGQVQGQGHGMEDNVYMPIVERNMGRQVATLAVSPDEYVVDAHTMSALGNGSADAGAKVMDNVVDNVREKAYGTDQQPNEINGLAALRPMIERV